MTKMRELLVNAMLPAPIKRQVNQYLAACATASMADEKNLLGEITAIVNNGDLPAFHAVTQYMVVGYIADRIIEECGDPLKDSDNSGMSEQERWLKGL